MKKTKHGNMAKGFLRHFLKSSLSPQFNQFAFSLALKCALFEPTTSRFFIVNLLTANILLIHLDHLLQ